MQSTRNIGNLKLKLQANFYQITLITEALRTVALLLFAQGNQSY